jgi:DNA-binding transcriptional LysR family regulator
VSVSSFLVVPEIVARSDRIALLPERLVRDRADGLQPFAPPIPIAGFSIAALWHDRTSSHPGHRWIRDRLAADLIDHGSVTSPAPSGSASSPARHRRHGTP